MCIICIKPAGVDMPDKATRARLWRRNPDGAGLMYPYKGSVAIEKGFMTLNALEKRIAYLSERMDLTSTTVIMHFRITTHGGTCPQNTHPFPCTSNVRNLRATHTRTNLGIAHNGIIPISTRPNISDTMEYIADVLAPLPKGFNRNKRELKRIENEINGSRMVFLDPTGRFTKVGHWYTGEDGCLYSNAGFEAPKIYEPRTYTATPYWYRTVFEDKPWSCEDDGNEDEAFMQYLRGEREDYPW